LFKATVEEIAQIYRSRKVEIDAVLAVDSRGYILGAPLAMALGAGFVPITKAGKSPPPSLRMSYEKEYGKDEIEIPMYTPIKNKRVLIVDDLIATGGTLVAAEELAKQAGAEVVGVFCFIELEGMKGRYKLKSPFDALIQF
jgi:adenine phosphoribosyltransferase